MLLYPGAMTYIPSKISPQAAIIGAGPAGLMAAEILATQGVRVAVYDRMPSPGRKFLMAGRGGLNLTHSEALPGFLDRYGPARARMEAALAALSPADVIAWCEGLGQPVFVGSSGRVFPKAFKASPLLRAWLRRLEGLGVALHRLHDWTGWADDGALGADGGWTRLLPDVAISPLRPANCGFEVAWSDLFRQRFAGTPLKRIALAFAGQVVRGEAMISEAGIEGGAVYALSAPLREAIAATGPVTLQVDLRPDVERDRLRAALDAPRKGMSLSSFLRKQASLPPVAVGLVQEARHAGVTTDLADLIKALPLQLLAPRPLARAISTAGGIALAEIDAAYMLRRRPGVFAAGEMLDWEAPTGGYLLQACFATGAAAARGALAYLAA